MRHKTLAKQALKKTDVVILCGGMGTRLKKVLKDIPKPMADINGRPFMDLLIGYAYGYGARRLILCTGYKSPVIEKYYKNKTRWNKIIFSCEKKRLGTAGAIKNAANHIKSSTFLVMNGDSFCPVDLSGMLDFHRGKGALVSMALCKDRSKNNDCGVVTLNGSHRITGFQEKSKRNTAFINAGIYFFDKKILKMIPKGEKSSLEYDIFPKLIKGCFYGYITRKMLIDIGTPQRYKKARNKL